MTGWVIPNNRVRGVEKTGSDEGMVVGGRRGGWYRIRWRSLYFPQRRNLEYSSEEEASPEVRNRTKRSRSSVHQPQPIRNWRVQLPANTSSANFAIFDQDYKCLPLQPSVQSTTVLQKPSKIPQKTLVLSTIPQDPRGVAFFPKHQTQQFPTPLSQSNVKFRPSRNPMMVAGSILQRLNSMPQWREKTTIPKPQT